MPGKIKVKVLAGRNLPVMDRASDTTDAFVEIKFGGVTHKTDVCRKSLNPHWNSTEWYRFEVDESELQDEPLQLRLMDHDTYSANDAIGKVVISLAPLLAREANNAKGNAPHGGAVMSGWIPVFDTMHGIRGELNVIVKVELFSDFNKYKTSSCGVQFFHCPTIPPGYRTTSIHGFVEELVVNDDPEYQWIDKIRTPRASNEARQVAFIKLSNQVQRLVGLKAAELGANAVVGYQQDFDLEGEAGVVARAIGTAVTISPLPTPSQPMNMPPCTQQQLKKYLDILSTDNENVTDLNEYYQHHQDELAKLLTILNPKTPSLLDETDINDDNDDEKLFNNLTRQSSVKSYTGNISIYQDDYISQKSLKHISEDQTDLNRLLNRDYFDSDTPGPLRKIKKFKSNFFLKRLSSMRGRKQETQDDQISLKSNSSDTSRISLVDIKNELKKFKRIKKPKFHKIANNADEGIGMASVLARSVIHAHTSLACIAETQDSEHSPNSTLRRASESEPTINMSDEDKPKTTDTDTSFDANSNKDENKQVPEIHFSSLMNINSDENEKSERRERRFSESCPTSPVARRNNNLLKPEDADYYGSVSSALSGDSSEIYSSSDEDDESSDVRTDTEKSVETTSSIVKSVLSHEINPAFIAQMDRKLSILETENLDRRFVDEEKQKKIKTNADTYESDNTINEKKEKIVEKQHNATMFAHEDANTGERDKDRSEKDKGSPRHARHESYGGKEPVPPVSNTQNSSLHSTSTPMGIHRRSSDSDLSITPKGSSVNTPGVNVGSGGGAILKPSMNSNNLEMLEYPFLTMSEYPPGFIVHIGGTVCARSVKLVDGGGESAARAAWWAELRTELRAHARALRCNAVLAYSDTAAICEDVCVLSASGTAAVINLDCDFNADCEPITGSTNTKTVDETEECCSIAHVPYSPGAGPYRAELSVCGGCRRARVPAVVLASCAKPARLAASPRAITLTAVAARVRRTPPTGEPAARDISDQLPFLEYELHKLLIAKLRMQGANALFSLQTQVCVGERCVMALASGAAVRLAALPPPTPPRIKSSENDKDALEIQKALWDTFAANKAANGFDIGGSELSANGALPEVEGDESTAPALDLCSDKDACVLELDEAEDVETARSLATRRLHTRLPLYGAGLQARSVPPHAFTQVWRARLQLGAQGGGASAAAERHVARALDGVAYKLRRLQPCAALAPRLQLDLPEDEIQLVVSGAAIPLVDPTKPDINQTENSHMQNSNQGHSNQGGGTGDADDDIFALDEEQLVKTQQTAEVQRGGRAARLLFVLSGFLHTFTCEVSAAAGGRRPVHARLLFVRETTCVRELGGLSGFLHTFTCEVLAIVRAYTAALGGNALTSFYITQLMLQDNAHKNQGQCLLSVGGDVVHITY
ncbi:C2 domain-containing protein 5 [Galleria mellonella]|uniref:C2 domain-containing protein 5 n=1 Tax=Galleria mellonella TaxID=7137 RepID=A0ABM3MS11_GALME|nr:C2 domain-containing protein 5 [Galleria mellonella]